MAPSDDEPVAAGDLRLGHRGWTATSWRAVGIASWAAARAALILIALSHLDHAAPLGDQALTQGPPLGHYEARLAQAELAAATNEPHAVELARPRARS